MQQDRSRHIVGHNAGHSRCPSKQSDQPALGLHVAGQLLLQIDQIQVALMCFGHLFDLHTQIQPRSQIVLRLTGADEQNGRTAVVHGFAGQRRRRRRVLQTENVGNALDGTRVGGFAENDLIVWAGVDCGSDELLGLVTRKCYRILIENLYTQF